MFCNQWYHSCLEMSETTAVAGYAIHMVELAEAADSLSGSAIWNTLCLPLSGCISCHLGTLNIPLNCASFIKNISPSFLWTLSVTWVFSLCSVAWLRLSLVVVDGRRYFCCMLHCSAWRAAVAYCVAELTVGSCCLTSVLSQSEKEPFPLIVCSFLKILGAVEDSGCFLIQYFWWDLLVYCASDLSLCLPQELENEFWL